MILVIDNYDSFVYNLARYVEQEGRKTRVIRNDAITLAEIRALSPRAIILSPGPCSPDEAGICLDLVRALGAEFPILGVCLGHQVIGQAYGGSTERASAPMHGKASAIIHDGEGLFSGIPSPMIVGRYHSLITNIAAVPDLIPLAYVEGEGGEQGTLMALAHKTHPVYGVQFHPESILTEQGGELMRNFLALADLFHEKKRDAA